MAEDGQVLAQDDIDALFAQDGELQETEESFEKPLRAFEKKPKMDVVEDAAVLSSRLYHMAVLKRDENVKVIWNASRTLSMNSGFSMKIEGIAYTSLGVLHDKHLVVRCEE